MKFLLVYGLSVMLCIGISPSNVEAQDYGGGVHDDGDLSALEKVSSQLDLVKSGNENLKLRLEMMEHHFDKQRQNHQENERKFQMFEEKLDQLQDRLLAQQQQHNTELKEMLGGLKAATCGQDQSEFLGNEEKTGLLREFQKVYRQQENILSKLEQSKCQAKDNTSAFPIHVDMQGAGEEPVPVAGVNVCWGIYSKILGELNSNLTVLQNIDQKLGKINDQYSEELDKHKRSIEISHGLLKFLNKKEESKICVRSNDEKLLCTEESHPTSCADYDSSHCSHNKCRIKNVVYGPETFLVACDDATDGGGWTVIQRRLNGSVDFYRGWSEYKNGFGYLDGEFWIGLDKLHALTTTLAPVELLIQLRDHDDVLKYAKYGKFAVGNETELYALKEAGDYEGNVGDSFSYHKGQKFSTKDKDNDDEARFNCAVDKMGAWWYQSCQWSNLNGFYYPTGYVPKNETGHGINWGLFHGYNYSLKFVQMMIRTKK